MHRWGDERGGGGVRWPLVWATVGLATLVLAFGVWLLVRDGTPLIDGESPEFSFTIRRVSGRGLEGKAPERQLRGAAGEVSGTLSSMYLAGFVDPDRWEDGSYPEVLEAFAPEAEGEAGRDLSDLTLGPAWAKLASVDPDRSRLDVKFLLGEDGNPFAAVATAAFRATATLEGGGTADVSHTGRYWLRPGDEGWRIIGYQVDGELGSGAGR